MDNMVPDWMTHWWFLGLMFVLLCGLVGLLLFLRSKQSDE
jgi:hypothetical protein